MTRRIIITGTDTGIGKTIFSAGLVAALGAEYWKPVQSGLEDESDSEVVARLSGRRVHREAYRLELPASPHISAKAEGLIIDTAALVPPETTGPLVIEGAGGLMVPLNRNELFVDLFAQWRAPVILCARTQLGTINHTLLSVEALKRRGIPITGIAFIGASDPAVETSICDFGDVQRLGCLPMLEEVSSGTLSRVFAEFIDLDLIKRALENDAS